MTNPFYILALLLFCAGCLFSRNNKYAAVSCILVAALAGWVGTYHVG